MEQKIVNIPLEHLHPHPRNPRKDLGDLSELSESIKAKGVLQNLTVVPMLDKKLDPVPGEFTVLIGHRRMAAAKLAGLTEVPCTVTDMDYGNQIATMLMENMQRSDLTLYEQAKGFQMMLDLGKSVSEVSEISGFSEATVRRRAKLAELDEKKFKQAVDRGATLFDFAELDKIEDPEARDKVLGSVGTKNFKNNLEEALTAQRMKKQVAEWVEQAAAFATKLDSVDWTDGKRIGKFGDQTVELDYCTCYNTWSKNGAEVKKPGNGEYYFTVSEREVGLYEKHVRDLKAEQEKRDAKERMEKHEKLKAQFKEISERHRKLRLDFVKDFNQYDRKDTTVWEFLTEAMIYAERTGGRCYGGPELEDLSEMLNVPLTNTAPKALDFHAFMNAKLNRPYRTALITAMWIMDRGSYYRELWDPNTRRYYVSYEDNTELDLVYRLLSQLGYLQSVEEQEMRKGTSKLFSWPVSDDE